MLLNAESVSPLRIAQGGQGDVCNYVIPTKVGIQRVGGCQQKETPPCGDVGPAIRSLGG